MSTPILFEKGTTDFSLHNIGLGLLTDCISCEVTEEINGIYELEMEYPVTGKYAAEIVTDRYVYCEHDDKGDYQAFRIYAVEKQIAGTFTVKGEHISYALNYTTAKGVFGETEKTADAAFEELWRQAGYVQPVGFDYDTEFSGIACKFVFDTPVTVRGAIGGEEGSILEAFGGEMEWDMFHVKHHVSRGADNGVEIRYGKNLESLQADEDLGGCYNYVLPYWVNETQVITANNPVTVSGHEDDFSRKMVLPLDVTDILGTDEGYTPTQADLIQAARSVLNEQKPWEIKDSIEVSFVQLWKTIQYSEFAPLLTVGLGDMVTVVYPAQNIRVKMEVVNVTWDVLRDRYVSLELGTPFATMSSAVSNQNASASGGVSGSSSADIEQLKRLIARKVNKSGDTMSGALDMSGNALRGLPTPQSVNDATRKGYVDTVIRSSGIAASKWVQESNPPFRFSAPVDVAERMSDYNIVELINDNPVLFAKHGFCILRTLSESQDVGQIIVGCINKPTTSVILSFGFGR